MGVCGIDWTVAVLECLIDLKPRRTARVELGLLNDARETGTQLMSSLFPVATLPN